jgi:CSLREA domain-containing protein
MSATLYETTRLRWALLGLSLAAALAGLALAGTCLMSGARAAGPYTVNSVGDAPDANLSDGKCETATPAECTLRAAIQQAQAASPGADTILITATGTITLTDNLPSITETLVISGPGSGSLTVDGADSHRHFQIASGVEVEISGLTLADGKAQNGGYWTEAGGAIYNEGVLTLNDLTILGGSAAGVGGAVYNALGSIAIIQNGSRIGAPGEPNVAGWGGGGIFNEGTLAITGTVSYNAADRGGGICNFPDGTATIVGDISHNEARLTTGGASGGGILNYQGMVIIRNSSIAYNHTYGSGGGIDNVVGSRDHLTMTNSTVSSNSANYDGGGIRNYRNIVMLTNNTIAQNVADHDQNGSGDGGGIYYARGDYGVISSTNNVLANNLDQSGQRDCFYDPVYSATITSQGYNLVENPGNCVFTATGDITGADPLLGPLQDNGGDTLTHALLPGSPAIDQGSCRDTSADQRGRPRPVDVPNIPNADDGCDIGAYEYAPDTLGRIYLPLVLKLGRSG